jgi:MFS family permease
MHEARTNKVVTMTIQESIQKSLHLLTKQERPFKINLLRQSSQNFLRSLTIQYQSIYITKLGASALQLGIANSIGGFASALVAIPTGWFADKHGLKKVFMFGTVLMALAATIFALAYNWIMIIPALIIDALALRIVMTACPMVCGSCLKNEERATGMQLCDTLSAAPRLISPMIAAFLITFFGGLTVAGIRPLYLIQVLGLILLVLLVFRRFVNPRTIEAASTELPFFEGMWDVFRQGIMVKRWILCTCLSSVPMFLNQVYLPKFAVEVKGADQYIVGGMATASAAIPLVLSLATGMLADVIGRKKVVYLTLPVYCSSLLLLVYATDSTMLIASGVLQGFLMLAGVTQGAITAELVPTSLLGRWYGILGLFRGVTSLIIPLIGGVIWSIVSPAHVFLFLVLTQVARVLIVITVPETLRKGAS